MNGAQYPFEGPPERGSARMSAVRPWQTARGSEGKTSWLVFPKRRRAGDFSRRAGRTQPEKGFECPLVSRGYLKIEGAARAFGFDFKDRTVLDIGSSTGGFTEYALDHGAKKVIAVEKGSHQMKAPLRFDPRIDLHEKTDIFDFQLSSEINTVVTDVSFLSLTKVLKYLKKLPSQHTSLLMMLKPQFEARPDQLRKGIVKNETTRREIIKNFEQWLRANGYIILNKHDNELHGKTGNIERFYYLKLAK